jgi:hypothetical protein
MFFSVTCDDCGLSIAKSSIRAHRRNVHKLSEYYQCHYCRQNFPKYLMMRDHLKVFFFRIILSLDYFIKLIIFWIPESPLWSPEKNLSLPHLYSQIAVFERTADACQNNSSEEISQVRMFISWLEFSVFSFCFSISENVRFARRSWAQNCIWNITFAPDTQVIIISFINWVSYNAFMFIPIFPAFTNLYPLYRIFFLGNFIWKFTNLKI